MSTSKAAICSASLLCAATLLCAVAAATNDIVAENLLPGSASDHWDVNGAGCPAVRGYITVSSALPGETVDLKMKIDAGERLRRVDAFRLGYYEGKGARRVGEFALRPDASALSAAQPPCLEERATALYDCGPWAVGASFAIPSDATSGLYFARMVLEDQAVGWRADASPKAVDLQHAVAGRDPALPPDGSLPHAYGAGGKNALRDGFRLREPRAALAFFVVRSRKRGDLVFQTADLTWHAYNGYGGYTTYGAFTYPFLHEPFGKQFMNLSDPGHATKRAYKRSLNTPVITRDYRSVNAPFGAELAAIRFLERNGYDVHYCSGADLADAATADDVLSRSRAYVSVGHDEYWTYEQREALERWRSRGLHLNFWSANEAYWAVRFPKGDARTMVIYKETQSLEKLDAPGEWTGTFRDARAINPRGAMPENALTGTMFAANAQRVDPVVLDGARFGAHRAWRGTAVRTGRQTRVALAGVLGHEWDEVVDNGASPPLLQKLSETSVDNVQCIMDHGATFDSGSATHNLVRFSFLLP